MWTNKKKFGKRQFSGFYRKTSTNERGFFLVAFDGKRDSVKAYESWQSAKADGWSKSL